MAELFCCMAEINRKLQSNFTPIKKKGISNMTHTHRHIHKRAYVSISEEFIVSSHFHFIIFSSVQFRRSVV